MIIVEPAGARYENAEAGPANEEHLLERISALESRLGRLTGKLERGLELLLRQAQNAHFDRAMVKSLVSLLTEDGLVERDKLERLWLERCQREAAEQLESEHREEVRLRILAAYRGQRTGVFEQFVNEGFLLLDERQSGRGIRSLQRAVEMAGDNASLLFFVGELFFKSGKTERAREYLAKAYELSPDDGRISLLLGLTCADAGDTELARKLLNSAMRLGGSSFAAHYGLGRLFAAEENWQKALQEFKLALASKASPEAHYALGCLYYQLRRDQLAARHLKKALELDGNYDEALYVLGLICERAGQKERAAEYFAIARPGLLDRRRANSRSAVAPLFRLTPANSRKIISGGDRRLAEALRQDALEACNSGSLASGRSGLFPESSDLF